MTLPTSLEAFDDVKRLIVVAAHPDDLETICGGTIALLVQRGVTVYSVNCTLGDIGTQDAATTRPAVATARLTEAEDAARLLGIGRYIAWATTTASSWPTWSCAPRWRGSIASPRPTR